MSKIINDDFLYVHMPRAEQVMLEKIPSESKLSHKFSRTFQQKMKALLKYEQRTPTMRRFVRQMKTVAAIFIIVLSMTFGTIISVKAYRVRFFKFTIEIWEKFTSIVIRSEGNADYDTLIPVEPEYVPDGYYLFEQQSNQYENIIIYQNDTATEICFTHELATQSEFIIDSENADIEETTIEDQIVYILVNKNTTLIYWYDKSNVYSLIGRVDKLELIKMVESIIKK